MSGFANARAALDSGLPGNDFLNLDPYKNYKSPPALPGSHPLFIFEEDEIRLDSSLTEPTATKSLFFLNHWAIAHLVPFMVYPDRLGRTNSQYIVWLLDQAEVVFDTMFRYHDRLPRSRILHLVLGRLRRIVESVPPADSRQTPPDSIDGVPRGIIWEKAFTPYKEGIIMCQALIVLQHKRWLDWELNPGPSHTIPPANFAGIGIPLHELVARTVARGDFGTPTLTIKCLGRAQCREVYIEFDRMSLRWDIPRLDDKGRINLPPGGASKATDSSEQQRNVKRLLAFMDTFAIRPESEVGWGDMESLFQDMESEQPSSVPIFWRNFLEITAVRAPSHVGPPVGGVMGGSWCLQGEGFGGSREV
ncbi:hypothetical protein B0H15DRAFT_807630 [Mycena belliarum]|uniref:Uncharacterized protein n=1 Tax=Mycena belliarum TaxID=1033014 RepID=A0AAD6TKH7_9AGAR|nr:hypothetical protein B0H15DRAFT_807630 [Mycena belliae]